MTWGPQFNFFDKDDTICLPFYIRPKFFQSKFYNKGD